MRTYNRSSRVSSAWLLALLLITTSTAQADPPSSGDKDPPISWLPGRRPDSQEPWGAFLGNAAHYAISHMYRKQHPENAVYANTVSIGQILKGDSFADVSRLLEGEELLRPDITDVSDRVLLEIKPESEKGLQEGQKQARRYMEALNRAVISGKQFTGGTDFEGTILIHFKGGR